MSAPQPPAIEAAGLVKRFGDSTAVDRLDLVVPAGAVFGILGPNGAGKTTTLRMLSTLLTPDEGRASVFGHDVVTDATRVRSRIAVTGQHASLDQDLNGAENLRLLARLAGYSPSAATSRADELLAVFGLEPAAGRLVSKYSGGMRRRLDIAATLVTVPDLLFLDEPTTGLDPRSRRQVWSVVRALVEQGTTVVLTSQYLDEVDALADRIAVIDTGRVIAEGTSSELKQSIGAGSITVRVPDADQCAVAADTLRGLSAASVEPGELPYTLNVRLLTADDAATHAARILDVLVDRGVVVEEYSLGRPTLDEVFFALTPNR